MEALRIFENTEFGKVRAAEIDGKAYFLATDVAEMLGYKKPHDAIARHCRWVVKHHIPHPQNPSKTLEVNIIPQGDVFRLVANCQLPGAEKFESWIFDEVVPAIFDKGYYALPTIQEHIDALIEQTEMYHYEIAEKIMGTHIGSYADWKNNKKNEEEQRKKRMWQEQGYKYALNSFGKYYRNAELIWIQLTPKEKQGHTVYVAGMNYFDEHLLLLIDKKLEEVLKHNGEITSQKDRMPNYER